jgi:hypothetical protein
MIPFYAGQADDQLQCALAGLLASASCNAFFLRRLSMNGRRLRRSTRLLILFQKPQK